MTQPERLLIEKLLAFRTTKSDKYLRDALKILEGAASELDHEMLVQEIALNEVHNEWEIVKNAYLMRFVNF